MNSELAVWLDVDSTGTKLDSGLASVSYRGKSDTGSTC